MQIKPPEGSPEFFPENFPRAEKLNACYFLLMKDRKNVYLNDFNYWLPKVLIICDRQSPKDLNDFNYWLPKVPIICDRQSPKLFVLCVCLLTQV